ncbi:CoA pyrophosphatase [Parafrigoribacterium mesophilum]|uniref:NUDIX hydrolase n=1 Tax=Parafrigoribacterium mesophilum TaxID=433646 RepID=UPI0031FCD319
MSIITRDARAELDALCTQGLDWALDPSRFLTDPSRARRSAVLVLFGVLDSAPSHATGPVGRDLDVLLQRRSETLGHHPGQISFPGGGVEASDHGDITATALREAVEETGLDPSGVEILGTLPQLPVPVSNNLVTPVLAWWTRVSEVAAVDRRESVDVFRVPVADLLDPANRAAVEHRRDGRTIRTPAFTVHGVLVWGFTGIVLARLFDELGWTVPWDHSRTVQP